MWPNPQKNGDLVTFTKEIINGKLHFLCGMAFGRSGPKFTRIRGLMSQK